ncbi:FKBP-type peptidyl-prolyl cis-trans isomerase [Microbacterium flavum]|uniref:peptidylprolyl isomerase n=1 Tax=Microbacterium flavum TaxID=415216 RepID=A0ABS5XVX6_9MICO|nr:FKBP-type peptidyl-prolyl cis-trans isomerase [Microbacterium flavum]
MRLRPIVALSAAAVSVLLLAGCAGSGGDASPTASGSASAAVDLCDARAASGDASKAVSVSGDFGSPGTATFTAPLEVPALQSTVITEGSGTPLKAGDFVSYAMTAYDAQTGEKLGEVGYNPAELLPQQVSADSPLGQIFGCGAPGERVVATFPATQSAAGQVYVIDLLSTVPTAAWGEPQTPTDGLPTVALADSGAPTITLPGGDAPTETTLETLKKGDGYTVQSGDTVLVQYTGVRWSDGKTFDSTWDKGGVPTNFTTTGVVAGFQKALEGQTVGSQVLVVIPPKDGYGEGEINDKDLKGDTLVFVVDILGAQKTPAQSQGQ